VLLVVGAQPAVGRAAPLDLGPEGLGQLARDAELVAIEPAHVRADEVVALAVLGAPLLEINAPPSLDDLGVDHPQALGAQAAGDAQKRVIAQRHRVCEPLKIEGSTSSR